MMKVKSEGVLPPEKVINPKEFFSELKKRGFKIIYRVEEDVN